MPNPTERAAYERGRADERADVVAWLSSDDAYELAAQSDHSDLLELANTIARREHMKGTTILKLEKTDVE
jgi:hypothetical protein